MGHKIWVNVSKRSQRTFLMPLARGSVDAPFLGQGLKMVSNYLYHAHWLCGRVGTQKWVPEDYCILISQGEGQHTKFGSMTSKHSKDVSLAH